MSTKTLRLQLEVGISGDEALAAVNKAAKDYDVTISQLAHTTRLSGKEIDKQIVSLGVQGKTYEEATAAARGFAEAVKADTSGTKSTIKVDQLRDQQVATKKLMASEAEAFREEKVREAARASRSAIASTVDRSKKATVDRAIAYERAAITHGAKSIEVFRVAQANKQVENEIQTQWKLKSIREKFAKGETNFMQQQKLRNIELDRFKAKTLSLHQQTTKANAKDKADKAAISQKEKELLALKKRQLSVSRQINSSTRQSIRHHKSLLRHVFDVVAGYRLINFAINKMQQGLLAVPKAGIQQQANIAALVGTFGSATAEEELAFVARIADQTGQNLEALETSFVKFAPSAKLAGASLDEVNQIFQDFSEVGTVLHKTPDEMQAIFLALEQMFAKGVVQSEEIKKQLGNQLPAAVEIAAEAMSMTPAAFMAAMRKNEIIASDAVPRIAAMYKEIFAPDKILETVSGQLLANYQRVITESTNIARDLFASSKATLNSAAKGVAELLGDLRANLGGVLQVASLVASLFATRLLSSLITVSIASTKAAFANIILANSFMGVKGGITTALAEVGLFIKKLTGVPPLAAGVVAGLTAITGGFLALGGATLTYTKQTSAEVKTHKRLADAWGEALIEQQKTSKTTAEITRVQREDAVLATEQALAEFESIASQSNSFYISVGENTVTLSNFVSATWSSMLSVMKADLNEFNTYFANEGIFAQDVVSGLASRLGAGLDVIAGVTQGAGAALAELSIQMANPISSGMRLTAETNAYSSGQSIGGAFAEGFKAVTGDNSEVGEATTSLQNTLAARAREASALDLAELKTHLQDKENLRINAFKQQKHPAEEGQDLDKARRTKEKELASLRSNEQDRVSRELSKISAAEEIISAKRRVGIISEIEANKRLREEQIARVAVLQESIEKNEALSVSDPSLKLTDTIREQRHQIDLLGIAINNSADSAAAKFRELGLVIKNNVQSSLANSFTGFITGATSAMGAMRDFASSVLQQAARMAANKLASQLLNAVIGAASGAFSSASAGSTQVTPSLTSATSASLPAYQPISIQAKGGVNTGMGSATNSILTSPTFFPKAKVTPFASGGVLAGEAGEEAVMPLKRNSQGRLGVSVEGMDKASGGNTYHVNITVTKDKDETASDTGNKAAIAFMKQIAKQEIATANRKGNQLNKSTAFG